MTSRGFKVFVAALALSAAVLAGCSSSKKHQTPITGTVPTTSVATTTSTTMAGGAMGTATTTTMAAAGTATTTTVMK